jgi:ATP-dependent helicase Lhr and Lhr-like helicase
MSKESAGRSIGEGEVRVRKWLASRGWQLSGFQEQCMEAYLAGKSGLVNAPTGSGKTYSLFLPAMAEYINEGFPANPGIRVLWITPLKALAKDICLAMQEVCRGLGISLKVAFRNGDIDQSERARQDRKMPEILIITPESLHLLFARKNHRTLFENLHLTVVDEWHELLGSKRGTQTELALSCLRSINSGMKTWALSASIGNLQEALNVLTGFPGPMDPVIIRSGIRKLTRVTSILPEANETLPWSGYLGIGLLNQVMEEVKGSRTSLLFTNTRSQTEIWYQTIMDKYPEMAGVTALHHGSLDKELRNWVEEQLHLGKLKLVICTSSLDLGVDFRPVENIIQVGSPKSIARFMQRAGRSGHQPGALSRICFVPTHAMELIEAVSLRMGIEQDTLEARTPVVMAFDVLAQYMVTRALGGGFREQELYQEIKSCWSYQYLEQVDWAWLLGYISNGGHSLQAYDDFRKVDRTGDFYTVTDRKVAMRHRLSMGTIVSDSAILVKFSGGRNLGTVEEGFISRLKQGDVFVFAGMSLELVRLNGLTAEVRKAPMSKVNVPSWAGGRMPLSSALSVLIRSALSQQERNPAKHPEYSVLGPILHMQAACSAVPSENQVLIEQCRSRYGYHIFMFPFEGRIVHEGMASLLATRIGRLFPVTFSLAMNDYGFELFSDTRVQLEELLEEHDLFSTENLLADIHESFNYTELSKRKFREIAAIAGLTFQGYPGRPVKTRHLQASSSLLFQVISEYEPGSLLLRQAHQEVLDQQLEEHRLRQTLEKMHHMEWIFTYPDKPGPFAFPILVDQMRERYTSEKLEDRIRKMMGTFA